MEQAANVWSLGGRVQTKAEVEKAEAAKEATKEDTVSKHLRKASSQPTTDDDLEVMGQSWRE